MSEKAVGCARPTGAMVGASKSAGNETEEKTLKEENMILAKVGAKAPDFQAPVFYKGGFSEIKLSDYFGKWALLCFYPGDFTFV